MACGILLPFLYFGIQILGALFYPDYSFATMDASELGSDKSSFAALFNIGVIIIGVISLFVAWTVFNTLWKNRSRPIRTLIAAVGIACLGVGSINAGLYPLPDQRHMTGLLASIGVGMIAIPFALPLAAVTKRSRWFWVCYAGNILVMLAMAFIVSGMLQRSFYWAELDTDQLQSILDNTFGFIQRITALAIYLPLATCSYLLFTDVKGMSNQDVGRER